MSKLYFIVAAFLILLSTSNGKAEFITFEVSFNTGPLYVISTERNNFDDIEDSEPLVQFFYSNDIIVSQKCYDIVRDFVVKKKKYEKIQLNELKLQQYCPMPIISYVKDGKFIFVYSILTPSIFNKFCRELIDTLKSNNCNNYRLMSTLESFICEPFKKK